MRDETSATPGTPAAALATAATRAASGTMTTVGALDPAGNDCEISLLSAYGLGFSAERVRGGEVGGERRQAGREHEQDGEAADPGRSGASRDAISKPPPAAVRRVCRRYHRGVARTARRRVARRSEAAPAAASATRSLPTPPRLLRGVPARLWS